MNVSERIQVSAVIFATQRQRWCQVQYTATLLKVTALQGLVELADVARLTKSCDTGHAH